MELKKPDLKKKESGKMKFSPAEHKELEDLLIDINLQITGYDSEKANPIKTRKGRKRCDMIEKEISKSRNLLIAQYPRLNTMPGPDIERLIEEYCEEKFPTVDAANVISEKAKYVGHRLAVDILASGEEIEYFLVTSKDSISVVNPEYYIGLNKIENPISIAEPLVRAYEPREPLGIYPHKVISGEDLNYINSYIPPEWLEYSGVVPDKLPDEVEKLFNQIVDPMDKLFFFHWLYQSITTRAGPYLVLQGDPAVGKNRMKCIIRALHGHHNTVDGKKSTLITQFNGQLADSTYIHFDELKYSMDEENIMKEIPNGTISIERKNKNATRSTELHCSMVISNNRPKDNYIAFDARKFSPIMLSKERLEKIMTKEEIAEMSHKIEFVKDIRFDISYIAQIGRWILNHGNRPDLFPQGEYRGPKFWELAHSSMFGWQKAVVRVLTNLEGYSKRGWERTKEKLEAGELLFTDIKKIVLETKSMNMREKDFPGDHSSAEYFLTIFRGLNGEKVVEVRSSEDKITGDFFIDIIKPTAPDASSLL